MMQTTDWTRRYSSWLFKGSPLTIRAIYDFTRVVAGPARELCAFRFAPSSTPTLSRSTSSPPNQPVTPASANPMNDSANAAVLGVYGGTCGALYRRYQLPR